MLYKVIVYLKVMRWALPTAHTKSKNLTWDPLAKFFQRLGASVHPKLWIKLQMFSKTPPKMFHGLLFFAHRISLWEILNGKMLYSNKYLCPSEYIILWYIQQHVSIIQHSKTVFPLFSGYLFADCFSFLTGYQSITYSLTWRTLIQRWHNQDSTSVFSLHSLIFAFLSFFHH